MTSSSFTATDGSRTHSIGARIWEALDEHPEMAHKPSEIARLLSVSIGSAKREAKTWRDAHKTSLLGPIYMQNVRLISRTPPGTASPGSPGPGWQDRGDNKWTLTVELPPDGRMDLSVSGNGTVEIGMAAERGFTPSEVLHALSFARAMVPLDPDYPGTFTFEALRDGSGLRLDGLEAVTIRGAESMLQKAYNHSDRRGDTFRMEIRTPPATVSLREAESWLLDRQPLGRDAKIEALEFQMKENSMAVLMLRREVKRALKRFAQGSEDSSHKPHEEDS